MSITIFREEATSSLAGLHPGPLSCSDWNLEMLDFVKRGKAENPVKYPRSKAKTNNKLNSHMATCGNGTWTTLVGRELSHHCPILTP